MKLKEKIKRVFHKITIPQWIKNIWQQIKDFFTERTIGGVVIFVFLVICLLLIVRIIGDESHWLDNWLGTDGESNSKYQTLKSLALGLAGLVGLLGLFISNRRAKAMEKQAEAQAKAVDEQSKAVKEETKSVEEQVKTNENKTFNDATGYLGNKSASVRLGGIYTLYDLALSNPEKRLKNIIEILSAHVRATTQEEEYQKKYKKKPSDEISSLLKLLSNLNIKYLSKNEEEKWYPLDLSNSYLCGIILEKVDFSHAIFTRSNFSCANLEESHFEDADLEESHFVRANLRSSHFEGAILRGSHFEGADLMLSRFEGADLMLSHFEGAYLLGISNFRDEDMNFEGPHFEGAYLMGSHFAGTFLGGSHFAGADLSGSNFACAALYESHFAGADLSESNFESACDNTQYNSLTDAMFMYNSVADVMSNSIDRFEERIKKRIEKETRIEHEVFFEGGITEEYIKDLEEIIKKTLPHFLDTHMANSFQQRMKKTIEALKEHQGQPMSHKIPEHLKGNIFLGELTKERANEIIKEYEKSMKIHDEIKKKNK